MRHALAAWLRGADRLSTTSPRVLDGARVEYGNDLWSATVGVEVIVYSIMRER